MTDSVNPLCKDCSAPATRRSGTYCNSCYRKRLRAGTIHRLRRVEADRLCSECGQRPSGRYLRCKACRYRADRDKCPGCEGLKTRGAKSCRACRQPATGAEHPSWRGGVSLDSSGYVRVQSPGHPRASQGYVREHHLVMEKALGRYLLPGENVHHKNGIRTDNRPENLELWISSQPSGQRVSDLVAWAEEILRLYKPTD